MSELVSEMRQVSGFDRIVMRGVGNLVIEPGDQESLRVEADSSVLSDIVTRVKGGKLHIKVKPSGFINRFLSTGPINYYVTVRELKSIEVSGAGKVTGSRLCSDRFGLHISGAAKATLDLTVEELETRISGAGDVRVAGRADKQDVVISGSGKYSSRELSSEEGRVVVSGAGKSTVNVSEQLDVKISGTGKVSYLGNPRVRQSISGVGRVSRIAG